MLKIPRPLLLLLVLILIGHAIYYYPLLPETIASHFNINGEADSFSAKTAFFILEAVLFTFVLGIMLFSTKLVGSLPTAMINLPNKDYWLAPERRAATLEVLSRQFEWLGVALVALFIAVNQLVFQANLTKENLSSTNFLTVLGIFLLFVVIWTMRMIRQFSRRK